MLRKRKKKPSVTGYRCYAGSVTGYMRYIGSVTGYMCYIGSVTGYMCYTGSVTGYVCHTEWSLSKFKTQSHVYVRAGVYVYNATLALYDATRETFVVCFRNSSRSYTFHERWDYM